MWRRINIFRNFRNIFRRPFGRGSLYRLERLSRNVSLKKEGKSEKRSKLSVDKGIKKYEKRQLSSKERISRFFEWKNIIILAVLTLTLIYVHFSGYSTKSLYISIFIFIGVTLYLLIVERFKEKVKIEGKINEIKSEREREHSNFLDRVKEIEEVEKNQLESIILKNSEDYDIKIWKVGRATSLLIGKKTPRNKVDIDVSEGIYSNLVSRAHGLLNRVNGVWYYEDLGSQNGSGIEKKSDRRKVKIRRNTPIKVESGDIIYLATTKLLLI